MKMSDRTDSYSSEELLNSMKMTLDGDAFDDLIQLLKPYGASGKDRFISMDEADRLNRYLFENSPVGKMGQWGHRTLDSVEILKGLDTAERGKCLMEANGYTMVLPADIYQNKAESGLILFNPEGQALITANQIWDEWKRKFSGNPHPDNKGNPSTAENVSAAAQDNSSAASSQITASQYSSALSWRNMPLGSSIDSVTPQMKQWAGIIHRLESRVNFQDRPPLFPQQRLTFNDPVMVKMGPELEDGFCKYKDARLKLALPCFRSSCPDFLTFLDAVYWYKIYTMENPGKRQYSKWIGAAAYCYRRQIANYVDAQLKKTAYDTGRVAYIERKNGEIYDVMRKTSIALINFFGINSDFSHCGYAHAFNNVASQRIKSRWADMSILSVLTNNAVVEKIFSYLNELTSYNFSTAMQLLELIGVSFLGSNFRIKACRDKNQVAIVVANYPECIAMFLQTVFTEGQRYFWRDTYYQRPDDEAYAGIIFSKWLEQIDTYLRQDTIMRTDAISDLQPRNGPAFIMDRYLGACVNVAAEELWVMGKNIDRAFVGDLVSGNRVTIPLWADGSRDSKELKEAKRNQEIRYNPGFSSMIFRSNMEYIFTTRNQERLLRLLHVGEKKIHTYHLWDVAPATLLHEDGQREEISFGILMLALYYVVDKYMLKRRWVKELEDFAEDTKVKPVTVSDKAAIQQFWKKYCHDATGEADSAWQKDPELTRYNVHKETLQSQQTKENTAKKAKLTKLDWQKAYGIDKLPTNSRRDICYVFALWCAVNHITLKKITSGDALMKELGQKLEAASKTDDLGRPCQDVFYGRPSISDQYYNEEIAQFLPKSLLVKPSVSKMTRIYRGLSLNEEAVNELVVQWNNQRNEMQADENMKDFEEELKFLIANVKAEVEASFTQGNGNDE